MNARAQQERVELLEVEGASKFRNRFRPRLISNAEIPDVVMRVHAGSAMVVHSRHRLKGCPLDAHVALVVRAVGRGDGDVEGQDGARID